MADLTVPLSSTLSPEVLRSLMDKYPQLSSQPSMAEQIVQNASVPPTASSAEQAAQVFQSAPPNGPGSAAESAGVFESQLPADAAELSSPAVAAAGQAVEDAALPSAAEGMGLSEAALGVGGKALGALAVLPNDYGTLATASGMDGPVPGAPGKYFQGQDIANGPLPPDSPGFMGPPEADGPPAPTAAQMADSAPGGTTAPTAGADSDDDTTASGKPVAPGTAPTLNPVVAAFLKDKADMSKAQDAANANRLIAGLSEAGAMAAHGLSTARGPTDLSGFKSLEDNANAPVERIQAQQAAAKNSLQNQMALMQTKTMADESDPASDVSKRTRTAYQPLLKMTGLDPASIDNLSAADIKSTLEKPLEMSAKIMELREAAKMRGQQFQYMQQDKLRHEDELEGAVISSKANYLSGSSRTAIGQAGATKMKIDRLNQILTDPNASPQDMSAAASDLAGTVSGSGGATISGAHGQEYNNLATELTKGANYLLGTTIPAQQSAAKAHMLEVAKRMDGVSNDVIASNSAIVRAGHEGWWQRHPAQGQAILDSVAQASGTGTPTAAASGAKPTTSQPTVSAAAPTVSAAAHPDSPAAVQWANNNKGDPRAVEILKRNGIQ